MALVDEIIEDWERHGAELEARAVKAEMQRDELLRVLKFYRDEWLVLVASKEPYEPTDDLWEDKGHRARDAIAKIESER